MEQYKDKTHLFHVNLKFLNINRLWTSNKFVFCLILIWQNTNFIMCFIYMIKADYKNSYASDSVETIAIFTTGIGLNLGILSFANKHGEILKLLHQMNNFDGFAERNKKRLDMLNKFTGIAIKIIPFLAVAYGGAGLIRRSSCIENMKGSGKNRVCGLYFQVWLPFDYSGSPQIYILILLQIIISVQLVNSTLAVYSVLFTISEHIIMHIEYLKMLLREMDSIRDKASVKKRVIDCVNYHNVIIDLVEQTNNCFASVLFYSVTFDTVILGMVGFQYMLEPKFEVMIHFVGWFTTLLFIALTGQRLLNSSNSIPDCIAELDWYVMETSVQRDLQLMILAGQKPLELHTGSIGTINFSTFLAMMKTSYSYIAVLKETI